MPARGGEIDAVTRQWVRNPADERAARNGCRFDEERGRYVCEWIETYCRLYEGEWAGQPFRLLDWARDATMRLFGWVRWSEKWGRWVRRFKQASIWLAKKNGKSPTLAAWGLYLLCGDGEPGQKVFLAAKDGRQAREIAGKHAVEMLLSSEELSGECSLNRNTQTITHLPTRSAMQPLSSSNSRTKQSKEGLNGSVLVDECHVVDRDFINRLVRAGISRSEPLQIEVSSAGNNPDGYGRERFDLARKVEQAEPGYEDDELFVAIHAAPQDLADADLDADPLRYARMANPAMGVLQDPEEFLLDFQRSRAKGALALAEFKMDRLTIWAKGADPWLRESDWTACRREFTENDLANRPCWAALDLARTRDMSALVLAFPEDGEEAFRLLPYFWMPEERAAELEQLAPFHSWARLGHLNLTPGGVTAFGVIEEEFRRLAELFDIRELTYDPKFAEDVTQRISEGSQGADGSTVIEGTGVVRVAFAQNDANYAQPTDDFERLVIDGKLWHNGHPVLSWQAGHAAVIRKINKVKRVVKPRADSWQTVDGVQAAIMALAQAMRQEGGWDGNVLG